MFPRSPEELRDALADACAAGKRIELTGGNSKRLMGGSAAPSEVWINTGGMRGILNYEPRDLTISVEAGMPFAALNAELARNGQMIPLDGPYSDTATVGGMIAANISGARRRLYGTARDLVIGMKFATLDGKLVDSGGMVVKNVAGLDMAKLMIGSFGTLAAIASVNFKLTPIPITTRTLLFTFGDLPAAIDVRTAFLRGVLAPVAVDLLNPILSGQLAMQFPEWFDVRGFTLAVSFAGNEAVMERCVREAGAAGPHRVLTGADEQSFWSIMGALTPRFLEEFADGAVVRLSTTLTDCGAALASVDGPGLAHAATGVVRGWFNRPEAAARCLTAAQAQGWKALVEFSSGAARGSLPLWPAAVAQPGSDFAGDFSIMKGIKKMFDPGNLLNRGRLYGQI